MRSVKVFVDGELIKRTTRKQFSVWIPGAGLRSGRNTIKVVAVDVNGRREVVSRRLPHLRAGGSEPGLHGLRLGAVIGAQRSRSPGPRRCGARAAGGGERGRRARRQGQRPPLQRAHLDQLGAPRARSGADPLAADGPRAPDHADPPAAPRTGSRRSIWPCAAGATRRDAPGSRFASRCARTGARGGSASRRSGRSTACGLGSSSIARSLRATLYKRGRQIWSAPVGIGAPSTPTPPGNFWIREKFKTSGPGGLYGPVAFGTSDYSVLTDWPGGGVIGIHGTNEPSLIPGRPSHGCIRVQNAAIAELWHLLPIGTPLLIR